MIVLDTHAWLWWCSAPDRLSTAAREEISHTTEIGVCTISVWELATLVRRGHIELDRPLSDWVTRAFSDERTSPLAPGVDAALLAGSLQERSFPGDPADSLIYAAAKVAGAKLVTRDESLRAYDRDSTLW